MSNLPFENPYRPGAGHMPPYLAGRENEYAEFGRLLNQGTILENLVLTGLRGVGKTVLLDTFKPFALREGWLWAGTDLSEAASVNETNLCIRLLTDLSVITSSILVESAPSPAIGFSSRGNVPTTIPIGYDVLENVFQSTPGLIADKLRATLEFAWDFLQQTDRKRLIFAYDEAQNLSDNAEKEQFPLSLLLDVFQSIQKKGIPFMLVLTGLPTLFPKLVEARTFAERMFRVVTLGRLSESQSKEAIERPLESTNCQVRLTPESVNTICVESGGYPYFIQFICREVYDVILQTGTSSVPVIEIQRKLDTDFFAGRWAKVTDRQRQLLWVIASLDHDDEEFTIQELVNKAKVALGNPFSSSHINQMLAALGAQGLIYKNRFGRYSFAVPLLGKFISRTYRP